MVLRPGSSGTAHDHSTTVKAAKQTAVNLGSHIEQGNAFAQEGRQDDEKQNSRTRERIAERKGLYKEYPAQWSQIEIA